MNLKNIRPIDHARAARLAMAVNSNDDAMAALVADDIRDDERDDSALLVMLAQAVNLVQLLHSVVGSEQATALLRSTLAQHLAAEDS